MGAGNEVSDLGEVQFMTLHDHNEKNKVHYYIRRIHTKAKEERQLTVCI
jgi:hypothetical protein